MIEIERPTYIKDAPPRVFDTHVHFPWRQQRGSRLPIYTADGMTDLLAYNCQRLNIYKVCLLGSPGEGNDNVEKAAARYPNLIVPFAMINVDRTQPPEISEFAERGFKGIKIINPRRNYDDTSYFPLYEQAEKHQLVILFHTGISGGMVDYLQFPPGTNVDVQELSRPMEENRRWKPESEADSWYGAARMQPIFLDGISVAFPDLKIIGAHLGYGLYDSAAAVARWRRNVYFDISGGTVVRRHLIERNMLRSEVSTLKLTWGSDCDMAHMSRELSNWMQAFADIGLSAEEQDQIFWGTAARIFGVDAV
jgi:predicted TIM-barrel fold metal-dependent hydrolase